MKTQSVLMTLALVLVSSLAFSETVQVRSNKHKDQFVFTAGKSMHGAQVTVYFSNGDMIVQEKLNRRKMVIDFCHVKQGEYTIVVKSKDGQTETFQFEKR